MTDALYLILLLVTKHFIVDFPLQTKFQYSNKGKYGHPGGLLHSFFHGCATYFCFAWFAPIAAGYLAIIDMVVHYHIDWAKVNINNKFGWGPTTHEQFWWLLGLDQFLHAITYVGLVYLVT